MLRSKTSCIFTAGTGIRVTNNTKDNILSTGTKGYMSFVLGPDQDFPNVVHGEVVVIRRGKGGKERLEVTALSTPIFLVGGGFKEHMPDPERKCFVEIETVDSEPKSVMDFKDVEFLGWATSLIRFVHKLSTQEKYTKVWPMKQEDILNQAYHAAAAWKEDPDYAKTILAQPEKRRQLLKRLRFVEASLANCNVMYTEKVLEVEYRAAEKLKSLWKGSGKFGKKKDVMDIAVSAKQRLMAVSKIKAARFNKE
jgi:hypothetical protein